MSKKQQQPQAAELEQGAASIFITMEDGKITVYHGETFEIPERKSTLHQREAIKGDWDKLWDVIRDEESKRVYMIDIDRWPYKESPRAKFDIDQKGDEGWKKAAEKYGRIEYLESFACDFNDDNINPERYFIRII